jgi:hypothetical protein
MWFLKSKSQVSVLSSFPLYYLCGRTEVRGDKIFHDSVYTGYSGSRSPFHVEYVIGSYLGFMSNVALIVHRTSAVEVIDKPSL